MSELPHCYAPLRMRKDVVQAASEAQGLLRVSAPQEFGRMLIATVGSGILARHPGVKLELNVTDETSTSYGKATT